MADPPVENTVKTENEIQGQDLDFFEGTDMSGDVENDGRGSEVEATDDQAAAGGGDIEAGGEDATNGTMPARRKSTRIRKETDRTMILVPYTADPQPFKPRGAPRYRFFRPPKRVYKASVLVDKDWTIDERERLLDAVSKVGSDDYGSMADIVGPSKTAGEIRDYLNKLRHKAKDLDGTRHTSLFEGKRHPHSSHLVVKEEGEPIERWLRVIDHLVSDNATPDYAKAIPDAISVIANLEQNQDPGTIRGKTQGSSSKDGSDSTTPDEGDDAVAPINFKQLYDFLYAILRGFDPPKLDPIEAWVILDLISDTASELKNSDLENQKDYLRCIYRDYCSKTVNLKWSNTSSMRVSELEESAVRQKRQKMERKFKEYLIGSKGGDGEGREQLSDETDGVKAEKAETRDEGSSTSTSALKNEGAESGNQGGHFSGEGPSTSTPASPLAAASTTFPSSSTSTSDINGQSQVVATSDFSNFHDIMIGGLTATTNAEDYGAFFTMNPFGVPISLLRPKPK